MWSLSYDIISNAIGITNAKGNCLDLSQVFLLPKGAYRVICLFVYLFIGL